MNCEFCGSTVLPGAKLCGACRSALKRARNDPQSILEPLVKRATDTLQRRKSRRSRAAGDDNATLIPPPVKATRKSATPAIVGAVAVVACVIGYALLQHLDGGARADPAVQVTEPAVVAATPAAAMPSENPEPAAVADTPVESTIAPIVQPASDEPESASHPAIKAKRARARESPLVSPAPVTDPVPVPVATPPPPPVAVAKAPAAPPDRRTLLRTAIGKCDGETLEKAFCEQRARIELCDGLWGTVPQCPAQRDYGN